MKYRPENNAEPVPGLPMYVEVETDGGFHVTAVWLVVGARRFKCTAWFDVVQAVPGMRK